ncbi:stalk domain-containing protein [Paenibacillus darwinianus]
MLFCALIGFFIGGYLAYLRYIPNGDQVVPEYGFEYPIVYRGEVLNTGAKREVEELKLPIEAVQQVLGADAPIRYEAETGSIILTTADKVLHMKTDALTASMNSKPFELTVAAETEGDRVYIPLTPLTELYGLQAEQAKGGSGIVTLFESGQAIQLGRASSADGVAGRQRNRYAVRIGAGDTARPRVVCGWSGNPERADDSRADLRAARPRRRGADLGREERLVSRSGAARLRRLRRQIGHCFGASGNDSGAEAGRTVCCLEGDRKQNQPDLGGRLPDRSRAGRNRTAAGSQRCQPDLVRAAGWERRDPVQGG